MYISNVKKITPIMFNGKNHAPDSNKNTTAPNKKESLLVGALMALATLSSPTVETKANNFDYDDFLIEYAQNSDSIAPARNITAKFRQGSDVGNCVGVATLKAFAQYEEGLEYLNSIVEKDKNNNFIVSFPKKNPITINKNIINRYEAVIGNDYAEAITFALYKDAGHLAPDGSMKRGKCTNPAMISLNERGTFERLTALEPNCSNGNIDDLTKIDKSLSSGHKLLITTSFKDGVQYVSNYKAFANHAFNVVDVDIKNNKVTLENPWYENKSEQFNMSIQDFQKYNNGMNILEMRTGKNKIAFINCDIGAKPGELIYDDYFDIINYHPTDNDYNNYFNKKEYKQGERNEFTLFFWSEFDPKGYEYCENNKFRIPTDEIPKRMPVYTLLKKEGYTPISLVKQYVKTKKVPKFNNPELQKKQDDIQKWLELNESIITYDIQVKHHEQKLKEKEANEKAEQERIRQAELEAQRQAEEARLQAIKLHNDTLINNLKKENYGDVIGEKDGIFPDDFKEYMMMFPGTKYITDKYGNKFVKYNSLNKCVTKYDKKGHIISEEHKDSNGKTVFYRKYTYLANGIRKCYLKDNTYDDENITLETFNNQGKCIRYSYYNLKNDVSRVYTYTISPKGERLKNTDMFKSINKNKEKYDIKYGIQTEYRYEFNEDGTVKREYGDYISYNSGEREVVGTKMIEYIDEHNSKIYWNGKLKIICRDNKEYDINGNLLSSYCLQNLPSPPEEM